MCFTDDDLDEVREMVVGQDWRWLVATFVVSIMHSWFSFLAFKNDVGFWKGRTNVEGLSVRSQWSNFICSTIIFLNIWESRGTASSIIVVETGIAALLEFLEVLEVYHGKKSKEEKQIQEGFRNAKRYRRSRRESHEVVFRIRGFPVRRRVVDSVSFIS